MHMSNMSVDPEKGPLYKEMNHLNQALIFEGICLFFKGCILLEAQGICFVSSCSANMLILRGVSFSQK